MAKLTAWRAVHPDLRSSNGFRWPFPGKKAVAPLPEDREFTRGNPCPEFVGDGLCLAKTWRGAASGGIPAITCLEVTYKPEHVLGEDADKVRVSECRVADVFDAAGLIRDGWMAGANLYGAYLTWANLTGADLTGANLTWANLSGANLSGANLYGANLSGANLTGADLSGAYGRDDWDALVERGALLLGAEHHAGCSGEYKKDDGTWAYRCKCGLRELRDERPVSPSVDPEVEP